MAKVHDRLREYGIPPDCELGKAFIKLDDMYAQIDKCSNEINKMRAQKEQLNEDIDLMETMIMYKFNKDTRLHKWVSKK